MSRHLICVTVDVDPDGLSGQQVNRAALTWHSFNELQTHIPLLLEAGIPITWFVRADGQLRHAFGSPLYLFEQHFKFWQQVAANGHEIGWHPHLYRINEDNTEPELIANPQMACAELNDLWPEVKSVPFSLRSFRNGEGWHSAETYNLVEKFGFICDSTAIPGRDDSPQHPRNWSGTPNQPYFPSSDDVRVSGSERTLLEVPMNAWYYQTEYDAQPRLRYMNPTIHPHLFDAALLDWQKTISDFDDGCFIWVLVFHPDEAMSLVPPDLLYAHSISALMRNLHRFEQVLREQGDHLQFMTLNDAVSEWKKQQARML